MAGGGAGSTERGSPRNAISMAFRAALFPDLLCSKPIPASRFVPCHQNGLAPLQPVNPAASKRKFFGLSSVISSWTCRSTTQRGSGPVPMATAWHNWPYGANATDMWPHCKSTRMVG